MPNLMLKVDKLSKRYRIGAAEQGYKTFRETIMDGISAPIKNLARLQNLTKFKEGQEEDVIWALKDVSFEINEGEVLGIIGRNGAGKTTLLKLLARITEPTSGFAEIYGRVSSLLEVGTGFHPELTGRENIFLNGAILGMRKQEIERKFDEIVSFSGVGKFIDTPVKRFSTGMSVRLAFAVAAHLEPEILLIDEVLAVGDYEFQKKCLGKMGDIGREGRTILFVSHNTGMIARLCERVILLDGGQIITDGPAAQVVEQYQSAHLTASAHWQRPKNQRTSPDFSFISVMAGEGDGKTSSTFPADQPIHIDLVYKIHRRLSACQVGVSFTNSMGVQVFGTGDSDSQNVSATPRVPGTYHAGFVLPAHFLAPGHYTVTVSAHMPRRHTYEAIYDVIGFEVLTTGSLESLDGRKQVVSPLFVWHTDSNR